MPRLGRPLNSIGASAALALLLTLVCGAPAALAAPYEPNDTLTQATGPMVGGQDYDGEIETTNDVDWFYFNVKEQRQLDISLTSLSGSGCSDPELYNPDGRFITEGSFSGNVARIRRTAPYALQWAVRVDGTTACKFRLRVEPADAITQSPPGVVVQLNATEDPDDLQRLFLNGQLVGTVGGNTSQSYSLGQLPADAQLTFEAENGSDDWSWNFIATNHTQRQRTTVLSEEQYGGSSSSPRVGVVRRVTFSPTGGISSSCGEALAPTTCIPVDNDRDGSPAGQDCNDSDAAIRPGAPEIIDNGVDENCDRIVAVRAVQGSRVSLRRRGKRLVGRVSSAGSSCLAGRRVTLRRKGYGRRAFGRTTTKADGSFRLRKARRLRRGMYVVVSGTTTATDRCRSARSRRVRG